VSIPTTDGKAILEAELGSGTTDEMNPFYTLGVVVTHPMPMLGGDMRNNVVSAVCNTFRKEGATTVRFNFRGVGNSSGSGSWQGAPEGVDVLSCCKFLLDTVPHVKKILLIGYSYGSVITSSVAADHDQIIGYAAISYPFGPLRLMLLGWLLPRAKIDKPKFFIIGDNDNFTGKSTFMARYNDMPEPKSHSVVSGGDHFWSGNEAAVVIPVLEWARRVVGDRT